MPDTTQADPQAAEAPKGQYLEVHEHGGLHTGTPAYEKFSTDMRALIKAAIMPKNATDPELYYLLEVAATYGLSPFTREIWAARMKSRDGDSGPISIMIGEAGMIAIADRHPAYRGWRGQPVYEKDEFRYSATPREMPDGTFTHVVHEFSVIGDRGPLIGAWAEVYREDRPPTFFWAPLNEYEKTGEYSPWKKQKAVMILKCALVTALRRAFRISNVYIADEMTNQMLEAPAASDVRREGVPVSLYGTDAALAAHLKQLFDAVNAAQPQGPDGVRRIGYSDAKRRMMLASCKGDQEQFEALADVLEHELEELGVEVPERPVVLDGEAEEIPEEEPAAPMSGGSMVGQPDEVEDAEFDVAPPEVHPDQESLGLE